MSDGDEDEPSSSVQTTGDDGDDVCVDADVFVAATIAESDRSRSSSSSSLRAGCSGFSEGGDDEWRFGEGGDESRLSEADARLEDFLRSCVRCAGVSLSLDLLGEFFEVENVWEVSAAPRGDDASGIVSMNGLELEFEVEFADSGSSPVGVGVRRERVSAW